MTYDFGGELRRCHVKRRDFPADDCRGGKRCRAEAARQHCRLIAEDSADYFRARTRAAVGEHELKMISAAARAADVLAGSIGHALETYLKHGTARAASPGGRAAPPGDAS